MTSRAAREALVAVGTVQAEAHVRGSPLLDGPVPAVEALEAAVQGVAALVRGDRVLHPVEREPGTGQPVAEPSDRRPEIAAVHGIRHRMLVPENDVRLAVVVGDDEPPHRRAGCHHLEQQALGGQLERGRTGGGHERSLGR